MRFNDSRLMKFADRNGIWGACGLGLVASRLLRSYNFTIVNRIFTSLGDYLHLMLNPYQPGSFVKSALAPLQMSRRIKGRN